MIDHDKLFDAIRKLGSLNQIQVDSINAILEACKEYGITSSRQIAYVLATAKHEANFKPVEEIGKGKGYKYGAVDKVTGKVYYGRGFVQLTWDWNYKQFGKLLGIDLYHRPELALQIDVAAKIIVIGMKNGIFTGVGLSKYFNDKVTDPVNARKIVNGLDKAQHIADFYNVILTGLK